MSKDLEALVKYIKLETEYIGNDTYKLYIKKNTMEFLEQALQRLESIDQSNPSEALKELEELLLSSYSYIIMLDRLNGAYPTIKNYILKAQEQEKTLKIMKDKWVNVTVLIHSKTVEEYNSNAYTPYNLTQEEFELLKEHFK